MYLPAQYITKDHIEYPMECKFHRKFSRKKSTYHKLTIPKYLMNMKNK